MSGWPRSPAATPPSAWRSAWSATGALRLVDLDAPAGDYLRAYSLIPAKPGHRPPTVRQLLTHTAGLPQLLYPTRAFQPVLGETVPYG
jgi:hypothetical protein